jgi:acyl-CoA reductase-like NAD-dependent aldehyde dehydrogenase
LADRLSIVARIAEVVAENADELTELMVAEIGKPRSLALAEVKRTSLTFKLSSELAVDLGEREIDITADPRNALFSVTAVRVPVGPVLAITPYNWPFNLAAHKIGPALAAGCPVVLKGSPQAALCTSLLARLIHSCGLPDGVFQYVNTSPALSERMVVDPRIKAISFTGSDKVGWHIKSLVPQKKVALELGGDAASLVLQDASLDYAAKQSAVSAMAYAGQVCISLQRLIVQTNIYDEFKERFIHEVEQIGFGDPTDDSVLCGPVISDEAADRIMSLIDAAESAGAAVLTGGNRIGRVIEPTVLEDVPTEAELACGEAFGPICTIGRCADINDGLRQMDASRFGLQGSIYTSDPEAVAKARLLELGGLVVNDAPSVRFDAMPYGGIKASGFGREGPSFCLDDYTEWQSVVQHS